MYPNRPTPRRAEGVGARARPDATALTPKYCLFDPVRRVVACCWRRHPSPDGSGEFVLPPLTPADLYALPRGGEIPPPRAGGGFFVGSLDWLTRYLESLREAALAAGDVDFVAACAGLSLHVALPFRRGADVFYLAGPSNAEMLRVATEMAHEADLPPDSNPHRLIYTWRRGSAVVDVTVTGATFAEAVWRLADELRSPLVADPPEAEE